MRFGSEGRTEQRNSAPSVHRLLWENLKIMPTNMIFFFLLCFFRLPYIQPCAYYIHTYTNSSSVSEGHLWMMLLTDSSWYPSTAQSTRLEDRRGEDYIVNIILRFNISVICFQEKQVSWLNTAVIMANLMYIFKRQANMKLILCQ